MSSCEIYIVNEEKRTLVGELLSHTKMSEWLKNNGGTDFFYEIWKGYRIHSRWYFKNKTKRWARTSTPRNIDLRKI